MADVQLFLNQSPKIRKQLKAQPELLNDPDFKLPIHISYPVRPGRLRISTGIKIRPAQWDKKKQKVNRKHPYFSDINTELEFHVHKLDTEYRRILYSGEKPTADDLRKIINPPKEEILVEKTFWDYYDEYIETDSINLTEGTLNKIRSSAQVLRDFDEYRGKTMTFDEIDEKFYQAYLGFLSGEKGIMNNTISKHIKALKRFLNYGLDKDWHNCTEHRKSYFKPPKDNVEVVSLSLDEVRKLKNHSYSKEKLERAKDMFIFGCSTGMRIGDILKLQPENIANNEISLTTRKNRKNVRIPLTKECRRIVEKYRGNPLLVFPKISQQKAREHLKEAAKEAGLTREIIKIRFQLTKRVESKQHLHELIGFHHAKRTAVSLMLQNGMDRETVLMITGNSNDTIQHYINIENEHTRNVYLKTMDNIL